MSEAAALSAFNAYIGGFGVRATHESGAATIRKSRSELADLFLTQNPEFAPYREELAKGDDAILSRQKFEQKGQEG